MGVSRRAAVAIGVLVVALGIAALGALFLGSVSLSPAAVWQALVDPDHAGRGALAVVRTARLPRMIAALLAGGALGLCGVHMQTVFRNPLADPFVLGTTSGASFGVAIVVLVAGGGSAGWLGGLGSLGQLGISGAAFVGAMAVTLVALAVAHRVRGTASILIVGLMIGYLLSALVSLLVAGADPTRLREYVAWGFGSFSGVTNDELRIMAPVVLVGAALSLTASEDAQRPAARRALRRVDGRQRASPATAHPVPGERLDRRRHGVLRPDRVHRRGRAAPRPPADRHLRPPRPAPGERADRLDHGAGRLGGGPAPGSAGRAPAQRRHGADRRAGGRGGCSRRRARTEVIT